MKLFNYLSLGSAMLLGMMISCSSEEPTSSNVKSSDIISLTSSVRNTRAAGANIQSTSIEKGSQVGVFVNNTTGAIANGTNNVHTAGENGSLSTASTMQWPEEGSVSIYAYAPYNENWKFSDANTFSVKLDQSSVDNYVASDLLYGYPTGNNPITKTSDGSVELSFGHKLARLVINITNTSSDVDVKGATVKVLGTIPSTTLDLSNGTLGAASGSTTAITAVKYGDEATAFEASVIIIPQKVSVGNFIQVDLKDGTSLIADLSTETTFESGKSYSYTVNIGGQAPIAANLVLGTGSVSDWTSGTGLSGTGNVVKTYGVGDYLMSDGKLVKKNELDSGEKPVAVIFSTEVSETDRGNGYVAYAMGTSLYTGRKFEDVEGQTGLIYEGAAMTLYSKARQDFDGLTETNKLLGSNYYKALTEEQKSNFVANMTGYNVSLPSEGTSGWYLPSIGQMFQIMNKFGGYTIDDSLDEDLDENGGSNKIMKSLTSPTLSNAVNSLNLAVGSEMFTTAATIFATSTQNGGSGHAEKYWGVQFTSDGLAFGKNLTRKTEGRTVIPVVALKSLK